MKLTQSIRRIAVTCCLFALSLSVNAHAKTAKTQVANPIPNKAAISSKPVLDPERFFGKSAAGYEAARKAPEVCAKLFCYCGCDLTDKHTSLLDCFTSDHGDTCEICQDEAIMGLQMKTQGKTIAEIQKAIDDKFVKEYPFDKPSKALAQYRRTRLHKPTGVEKVAGTKSQMLKPPKLKPGKTAGDCCGHENK